MDLSNFYGAKPLNFFTYEQKRSCILMWVALNMKLKLKEYNLPNSPTGYSTRLWGVGRGKENTRNFMENRVKDNIKLNTLGAEDENSLKEIMKDLSTNIVEHSLIVCEDLIGAARKAKTESVREKYYKAVNNSDYLKVVFIISVSNYAKELIKLGFDINHVFLKLRLETMDVFRKELNDIWIEYAESDKNEDDYFEAITRTEEIFKMYEKKTIISTDDLDKLADEKLVYNLMGKDNIDNLIEIIIDGLRQRITGEIRLFSPNNY